MAPEDHRAGQVKLAREPRAPAPNFDCSDLWHQYRPKVRVQRGLGWKRPVTSQLRLGTPDPGRKSSLPEVTQAKLD